MKMEDIRTAIFDQMKKLKSVHIEPVCIVVSQDVMYEMESTYYNEGVHEYSPYFSKVGGEEAKATFVGIPIGAVDAGDDVKGYIQVGGMV